jgi:diaminopimelate decarboxylase
LANLLAEKQPGLPDAWVKNLVRFTLDRREALLGLAQTHGSPLYVFEPARVRARATAFLAAFRRELPEFRAYFAMKSNNHPAVSAEAVRAGLGLDVSSGVELAAALALGCEDIIFSGPGKSSEELELAVLNCARVTVLLDSFAELGRLEETAARHGAQVRAGVRLTTEERGLWRKFGIPLARLGEFFEQAECAPHVDFSGLQFHTSWNLTPAAHVAFLRRLGDTLGRMRPEHLARIRFVDIGGGFWPEAGEWVHRAATPQGRVEETLFPERGRPAGRAGYAAQPVGEFAARIAEAVRLNIFPHVRCAIHAEPGRWICHEAMHLLLTVADKKDADLVVTDGGTNLIGWERFEADYFPVVNLSRPDEEERECLILGSLCTPHDVWGYAYFGAGVENGDVLVIPWQGAYTWSLRQEFIKPLAPVVTLPPGTDVTKAGGEAPDRN